MTVTVKLTTPINDAGKTYTELTFREAKVGDLVAADHVQGEFAKILATLAGMAGVSLPAMKEMSMADFKRVSEEVAGLMGESPAAA